MSKLIRFIRTTQKCSKLKVSPHFEELGVMQDSSILRYLCSSCCQKFPETGDKNLLIPTFPTNLSQGACVQEKSYEENSILFHFRILSRCGQSSVQSDSVLLALISGGTRENKPSHYRERIVISSNQTKKNKFLMPFFFWVKCPQPHNLFEAFFEKTELAQI